MQNRILKQIKRAQKQGGKLFCAFVTLGYPSLPFTEKLIEKIARAGADMIELGFPFSDPLADGPTIQFSSEAALRRGVQFKDAFALVKRLRRKGCEIPIIFFGYLNPIYHYGIERFSAKVKEAGFDGLIVPDLLPEEEKPLSRACRLQGLYQIYLVAPTTETKRVRLIARKSQGFVYYVSLRGVTGARKALADDIRKNLSRIRPLIKKPILIGFGISSPEHAKALGALSDGIIVGSAIVEKIRKSGGRAEPVAGFVKQMARALKGKV